MKTHPKSVCLLVIAFGVFSSASVRAQNESVIHWINSSSQNGATTLNNTSTFTTNFRTANDVAVTLVAGNVIGLGVDSFGGATPGNNPSYLTGFVGSSSNGTGDGTAGDLEYLDMFAPATGSLRLDFTQPITTADRLLFIDTDSSEQYRIEAFSLVGSTYTPLSLVAWTYETFSGQTGVTPDSRWPTWDANNGLLTATSSALNEELSVLTPSQTVDRLVITKLTGAGASTGFQVLEAPEPSTCALIGAALFATICWRRRLKNA